MSNKIESVEEFDDFINELNKDMILQESINWSEDLPDDKWEVLLTSIEHEVDSFSKSTFTDVNVDNERGCYKGLTVFRYKNDFYGCYCILRIDSTNYVEDMHHILSFTKLSQVPSVTYVKHFK